MAIASEINVSLGPEMIEIVQRAVDAGEYANPSEVVEDALRTWTSTRTVSYDVEYLRAAWNEAMADDSPGVPMDEVFDRLDRHYAAMEVEPAVG
jgi:putative addiction module CopG family antidote